ncbi:MAG: phospholipase [Candidatus Homeothermus sp.]|nr:phospholipase [Candidatus Homeothermus sp.]PWL59126.1 MAG: phospholipase [Bacteroidales bacterium]
MEVSLIILGALVAVGLILYLHDRHSRRKAAAEGVEEPAFNEPEEQCCGMHITCERDSLLASVSDKIEYYDDEELDAYIGRKADDYTDEEIEQFRDVLLTLLPEDIAGWGRSIQLRGIELPSAVKEELLMIVAEARREANIVQ